MDKNLHTFTFTHMKVKIIDGNKKLNVQIKSTNHRMLTDSFGFGPQLCSGTAPLPAVRTRGREKVREGGVGSDVRMVLSL